LIGIFNSMSHKIRGHFPETLQLTIGARADLELFVIVSFALIVSQCSDAYERKDLEIGPDTLNDIAHYLVEVVVDISMTGNEQPDSRSRLHP
jgi:hypothetical protein